MHVIRIQRYNHRIFWGYFSCLTRHKYSSRIANQVRSSKLYRSALHIEFVPSTAKQKHFHCLRHVPGNGSRITVQIPTPVAPLRRRKGSERTLPTWSLHIDYQLEALDENENQAAMVAGTPPTTGRKELRWFLEQRCWSFCPINI